MPHTILAPKDFWLGIAYLVLGSAGIWYSLEYPMGTAARMGPGYLPRLISGLLVVFGVTSLVRSVRVSGEPVGSFAFRPLLCVLGGVLAFAILGERAGLVAAIFALVLISATGSSEFRFQWTAILGLVGFIAFCALVFVKGLGVPMPMLWSP